MSPLRQLVKAHSDKLVSRDEYLHIRTLLMNKLEQTGEIRENDLENYLNLNKVSHKNLSIPRYNLSDILIAILGLCAAATLAYILYT